MYDDRVRRERAAENWPTPVSDFHARRSFRRGDSPPELISNETRYARRYSPRLGINYLNSAPVE